MPEDDEPVNPIDFYSIYLNTEYSEEPKSDFFCLTVSVIPHTAAMTNIGKKKEGDMVNVELDILCKYVRKASHGRQEGVTEPYLKEKGFI